MSPPRSEARRQELLDATMALIRREGPFVSMEQIAAENGVTKPIIYRHFGDRDGLVLEIAGRFIDNLVAQLAPRMSEDAPPYDVLHAMVDTYLAIIEQDPNMYRFLAAHAGSDRHQLAASLVAEQIADLIERIMADRGLDPAPARTIAYALVGMVHFTGDWWIDDCSQTRTELVDRLVALVWSGAVGLGFADQPTVAPPHLSSSSGGSS